MKRAVGRCTLVSMPEKVADAPSKAELLAADLALVVGSHELHCLLLQIFLSEATAAFDDKSTTAKRRAHLEKGVDRLWKAHKQHTTLVGTGVRRLAGVMEVTSRARESYGSELAKGLFVHLLQFVDESAMVRVNATSLDLVEICMSVWRRRAGAPSARDKRPPKWDAFAKVAQALGYSEWDPADLKKECSPTRKKNGRKLRP